MSAIPTPTERRGAGSRLWFLGLAVTLLLAVVASSYASDDPDGLEKVAADEGFRASAEDHDLAASPLSDYAVEGVADDGVSLALAGGLGVALTLLAGGVVFWTARRRSAPDRLP